MGYGNNDGYEGPAGRLVGRELSDGWVVKERVARSNGATGGLGSIGYRVQRGDRSAYMKAHDYAHALSQPHSNFSQVMEDIVRAYNFERDLNRHCTDSQMSRVVRVLAADALPVEGSELPVNYLIFELAEADVRHRLGDLAGDDLGWKLRTAHHVATGLRQLHMAGVAHQDLKPSNVMDFGGDGSKVGDLGSAWHSGEMSPLVEATFPGDPDYAPPECHYEFEMADVRARLKARDLYLFGSLVLFLFMGVDATCALLTKLPKHHRPGAHGATFDDALPHLIEASDCVADEFEASLGDGELASLADRYRELCNPDPRRRGHPKARVGRGDPYVLDRYVSYFDHMANLAEGNGEGLR